MSAHNYDAELLEATDSWAKSTCDDLGLKPARDNIGFRVAEISRWIVQQQDLRATIRKIADEYDAAHPECQPFGTTISKDLRDALATHRADTYTGGTE